MQDAKNRFILANPMGAEMLPFFLNSLSLSTQRLLQQTKSIQTLLWQNIF